jgi:hypothetical protein
MNTTVARIIFLIYIVVFACVFNGFYQHPEDLYNGIGGGGFGHTLAPLPVILMDLVYAFFITNFMAFLVNTLFAIKLQFVTFVFMFISYGVLNLISNI